MKVLYFDLERGSHTLGSEKHIAEMFGYSLLRPGSWDSFQHVISQLYTKKNTVVEKKVGSLVVKEEQEAVILKEKAPVVDALVVDTFSELSKKYMRSLIKKETGKMMLQDWGKLRNKLDNCLEFVTRIPGVVICNVHAKDRTGLLDQQIPQDFQLVINAANEMGFDGCRILVIGSPGSGKTYALRTLIHPVLTVDIDNPVRTVKTATKTTNGVNA